MRAAVAALCLAVAAGSPVAVIQNSGGASVSSPDGRIVFSLEAADGRLAYRIARAGRTAIESSPLRIVVDGANLGAGAVVGRLERSSFASRSERPRQAPATQADGGASLTTRKRGT